MMTHQFTLRADLSEIVGDQKIVAGEKPEGGAILQGVIPPHIKVAGVVKIGPQGAGTSEARGKREDRDTAPKAAVRQWAMARSVRLPFGGITKGTT